MAFLIHKLIVIKAKYLKTGIKCHFRSKFRKNFHVYKLDMRREI